MVELVSLFILRELDELKLSFLRRRNFEGLFFFGNIFRPLFEICEAATSEVGIFLAIVLFFNFNFNFNFVLPRDGPPLNLPGAPVVGPCIRVLHLLP